MPERETVYVFNPSDHGIFAEIYFPRKTAHQGTIFNALRDGYDAEIVKKHLNDNIKNIIRELEGYPRLFDPYQYGRTQPSYRPITKTEAVRRVKIYQSPFFGWSTYQVDGVFFSKTDKLIEEATQVVRIMFKFQSKKRIVFKRNKCLDVLRAILVWTINKQDILEEQYVWDNEEFQRFIEHHEKWPERKKRFAEKYFTPLAREVAKWIDDCALFIFGYLVRKFSRGVIEEKLREEEIWVVSFFNLTINVIQRTLEK